jgi:hypothetical protein
VTQESNLLHPKLALAQLGIQYTLLKLPQYQMELFFMFLFTLGENQYIIDEHYDELI